MAFTKQHYKAIAEIIGKEIDPSCLISEDACDTCKAVERIARTLTDYFEKDNPLFDRKKFLDACGI